MKVKAIDSESVSVSVHPLRDARLSLKAKGLLAIIIAWPPGDHLTMKALAEVCTDGRVALNAAWKELAERGYLVEDPDGYRVAQNLHFVPGKVSETNTSPSPRIELDLETLRRLSEPDGIPGSARNRHFPTGGSARNRQKAPDRPVSETDTSDGQKCTKPTLEVEATTVYYNIQEGSGINDTTLEENSLLDGLTEEVRTQCTIFRNSWIGTFERMAPVLSEEALLGVDIRYYFNAIMAWSNKLNPKVKKNQRTVDGWVDTVRSAMTRDRERGELRMIGAPDKAKAKEDQLLDFLKIGRR